jgi:hypothetical protein
MRGAVFFVCHYLVLACAACLRSFKFRRTSIEQRGSEWKRRIGVEIRTQEGEERRKRTYNGL